MVGTKDVLFDEHSGHPTFAVPVNGAISETLTFKLKVIGPSEAIDE